MSASIARLSSFISQNLACVGNFASQKIGSYPRSSAVGILTAVAYRAIKTANCVYKSRQAIQAKIISLLTKKEATTTEVEIKDPVTGEPTTKTETKPAEYYLEPNARTLKIAGLMAAIALATIGGLAYYRSQA